jgi:hypothetical protein
LFIGLDFDNTLVCYDKAIPRLADDFFDLPTELPRTKLALREFLRQANREPEWTAFQGALYGPGMTYAEPFDQALETIQLLKNEGHDLCIVSHRSLRPYAGPAYDLHAAAKGWVEKHLVKTNLFEIQQTHFHETRDQKIAKIKALGCEVFLDDLPEVLGNQNFPGSCKGILFDPEGLHSSIPGQRIARWIEFPKLLSGIA